MSKSAIAYERRAIENRSRGIVADEVRSVVALLQHSVPRTHARTNTQARARRGGTRAREGALSIASLARSRVAPLSHVRHYVKKKKRHKRQRYLTGDGGQCKISSFKAGPRIQFDHVRVHTSLAGAGGRHILSVLIVRLCLAGVLPLAPQRC